MFREEEERVQEDEGAARKRSREVKLETNNPKQKTYFFGLVLAKNCV